MEVMPLTGNHPVFTASRTSTSAPISGGVESSSIDTTRANRDPSPPLWVAV